MTTNLLLEFIIIAISTVGASIIIWGIIYSGCDFIRIEKRKLSGHAVFKLRHISKRHLESYLIYGLNVLIASDIIGTISQPTIESLIRLSIIIILRTVLSLSLTHDLKDKQAYGKF